MRAHPGILFCNWFAFNFYHLIIGPGFVRGEDQRKLKVIIGFFLSTGVLSSVEVVRIKCPLECSCENPCMKQSPKIQFTDTREIN